SKPLSPPIVVSQRPELIPLSYAQERLWFVDQLGGSLEYHISQVHQFETSLDIEILSTALNALINRHESLRTVIREDSGGAYQTVLSPDTWQLDYEKLDDEIAESSINEVVENYVQQAFDLSNDHMIRVKIIELTDKGYLMVMVVHHIASDAWSMNLLSEELLQLYHSKKAGEEAGSSMILPALPVQYADYAIWEKQVLSGAELGAKLNYWEDKLAGFHPLSFPLDFQRPSISDSTGQTGRFVLDKEVTRTLRSFCQQRELTIYMFLLTAFKVLLHKYTGQTDICIGTSLANRSQKELEGLIGFFANLVALRSEVPTDLSYATLLEQIKTTTLEAYTHQDTPFEKVVDRIAVDRESGQNPLFQILFILQNTPVAINFKKEDSASVPALAKDANVDLSPSNLYHAQSDLVLAIEERGGCIQGEIGYRVNLFKESTIQNLAQHYRQIIDAVLADPSQSIAQIRMLNSEEENRLLYQFNDTSIAYPDDQSVSALFEQQVLNNPDQIALRLGASQLTYQELDERSNQLAHYLRGEGLATGDFVGLCLERSFAMIIGILGILKAGGVYVPMETDFPSERHRFIVEDTGLKILLCSAGTMLSFF
ncbi:MAG: condensation domain-containing protein, partial [Bacteroidota bacterium]